MTQHLISLQVVSNREHMTDHFFAGEVPLTDGILRKSEIDLATDINSTWISLQNWERKNLFRDHHSFPVATDASPRCSTENGSCPGMIQPSIPPPTDNNRRKRRDRQLEKWVLDKRSAKKGHLSKSYLLDSVVSNAMHPNGQFFVQQNRLTRITCILG